MSRSKFRPKLHVKRMIRAEWPDRRKRPVPFLSALREEDVIAHPGLFIVPEPPEEIEERWDLIWAEHRRREELAELALLIKDDNERYNESWWMRFPNELDEKRWLEEERFDCVG